MLIEIKLLLLLLLLLPVLFSHFFFFRRRHHCKAPCCGVVSGRAERIQFLPRQKGFYLSMNDCRIASYILSYFRFFYLRFWRSLCGRRRVVFIWHTVRADRRSEDLVTLQIARFFCILNEKCGSEIWWCWCSFWRLLLRFCFTLIASPPSSCHVSVLLSRRFRYGIRFVFFFVSLLSIDFEIEFSFLQLKAILLKIFQLRWVNPCRLALYASSCYLPLRYWKKKKACDSIVWLFSPTYSSNFPVSS